jgi:carboxylesterase
MEEVDVVGVVGKVGEALAPDVADDLRGAMNSVADPAMSADSAGMVPVPHVTESATPSERARPRTGQVRCILVHGFNGEPVDMRELEEHLAARGFATTNMLLPGHGTTLRSFAAARWEHWLEAVFQEAREALTRRERVLLIGHSMGAALALAVATQEPEVGGVVALCPPMGLNLGMQRAVGRIHRVVPYIPSWGEDVRDRLGVRRRYTRKAYRWVALGTAQSLFGALPALRDLLPTVRCPALVMGARHDHVVPLRDCIEAYKLLGSEEKSLLVLERSYHVVTKDVERHLVFARVAEFCEQHSSPPGSQRSPVG